MSKKMQEELLPLPFTHACACLFFLSCSLTFIYCNAMALRFRRSYVTGVRYYFDVLI